MSDTVLDAGNTISEKGGKEKIPALEELSDNIQ